jgi:hypothetical protein
MTVGPYSSGQSETKSYKRRNNRETQLYTVFPFDAHFLISRIKMIFLKENIVSDMRTLQKEVRHNFGPGSQKIPRLLCAYSK